MTAYYNEFDPKAAAWLRQLITNGDIAPGEVDERSITDVEAADLKGFSQHHFFAGIGVWSHALRNAGWSDDRPVCTASLPCQPFSAAGNQKGKDDERHLLPHFLELVGQCNFHTIFGEQVESAIRHEWLDDLQTVMERESYTVGHCVLGAHSVNSAHIRKRIYWVAHSAVEGSQGYDAATQRKRGKCVTNGGEIWSGHEPSGQSNRVANTINEGSQRWVSGRQDSERENFNRHTGCGSTDSLDWLYCRDQKYRPIKSGIEPLVDGLTRGMVYSSDSVITPNASAEARTIRLKGYGNAIVAPVATEFIRATMEVIDGVKTL